MRNLEETKRHLKQAYSALPTDFNLREVRFAVNQALQKLEQYEVKSNRREETKKQIEKQNTIRREMFNPFTAKQTIDIIDQMIAEEEKKIAELSAKKDKTKDEPTDDIQTFLG